MGGEDFLLALLAFFGSIGDGLGEEEGTMTRLEAFFIFSRDHNDGTGGWIVEAEQSMAAQSKVDVIAKGDKSSRSCDCSISRIMKLRWPGVAQIEENLGAAMSIHMILAPPILTTRGLYRPCYEVTTAAWHMVDIGETELDGR